MRNRTYGVVGGLPRQLDPLPDREPWRAACCREALAAARAEVNTPATTGHYVSDETRLDVLRTGIRINGDSSDAGR